MPNLAIVVVKGDTVIYVKDAKCLFFEGKVKNHGLKGGERVRDMVNNRKGACKVEFDICCDTDGFGISKSGKKTFPPVIIGGAGYGCPKWVKVGPGCLNGTNPGFLNKDNISSRRLKERVGQKALSIHIDRHNLDGPFRHKSRT